MPRPTETAAWMPGRFGLFDSTSPNRRVDLLPMPTTRVRFGAFMTQSSHSGVTQGSTTRPGAGRK